METVMNIMHWLMSAEGAAVVFGTLYGFHAIAVLIVNQTNTPKDDEIVGKAYIWIERLAGIWGYKAKQLPGEMIVTVEAEKK